MPHKDYQVFKFGRVEDMSNRDDLEHWRSRSDAEKFDEAWRLVVQAFELKGIDKDELRFQRSVASLKREER